MWHPLEGQAELTSRELEVLQLMANGLQNKQISDRLTISLHTAELHVTWNVARLGAGSRTEAVTIGVRRGHLAL